jgi:hypothetical protein
MILMLLLVVVGLYSRLTTNYCRKLIIMLNRLVIHLHRHVKLHFNLIIKMLIKPIVNYYFTQLLGYIYVYTYKTPTIRTIQYVHVNTSSILMNYCIIELVRFNIRKCINKFLCVQDIIDLTKLFFLTVSQSDATISL